MSRLDSCKGDQPGSERQSSDPEMKCPSASAFKVRRRFPAMDCGAERPGSFKGLKSFRGAALGEQAEAGSGNHGNGFWSMDQPL